MNKVEIPQGSEIDCLRLDVADNGGCIVGYDLKIPNAIGASETYSEKYTYDYRKEVFTSLDEALPRLQEIAGKMGINVGGKSDTAANEDADNEAEY